MDPSIAQIIVAVITVCVPTLATLVTTKSVKRQANKHSTRQSILQLILEDKIAVMEDRLPENYQAIMDEYDEYHTCYGNHYIDEKIEEYQNWYKETTKKLTKNK